MKKQKTAFTLIELLIVVAIIAILAAIAVPNFLEAQTRSKVSRAKADIRTTAVAIESYFVDHNRAPREYSTQPPYSDPLINGSPAGGIIFPGNETCAGLSTPIAYITTAWLQDPFTQAGSNIPEDEQRFSYMDILGRERLGATIWGSSASDPYEPLKNKFGSWKLISIGPDRDYFNNMANPGNRAGIELREHVPYDPTNGTVSEGNIIRSQNEPEFVMVVEPGILGAH